jgi:hypothetical protein
MGHPAACFLIIRAQHLQVTAQQPKGVTCTLTATAEQRDLGMLDASDGPRARRRSLVPKDHQLEGEGDPVLWSRWDRSPEYVSARLLLRGSARALGAKLRVLPVRTKSELCNFSEKAFGFDGLTIALRRRPRLRYASAYVSSSSITLRNAALADSFSEPVSIFGIAGHEASRSGIVLSGAEVLEVEVGVELFAA